MIKRNLKLFIKEKSTIIALIFELVFIVVFLCSFIPILNVSKGVRNDFETEKISFISSNGTDTTYLVSEKNHLFYSQYKNDSNSHLNKYTKTTNLGNQYGDPTSHFYNFIYVDYEFTSRIIKVMGVSDSKSNGCTLVLTQDGNLYILSDAYNSFYVLEQNVKDFNLSFSNFIIEDKSSNLIIVNLNGTNIEKHYLDINYVNNYFLADFETFYYQSDNTLYQAKISQNNFNNSYSDSYSITCYDSITSSQETSIKNVKKVATNGSATMLLTDNKVYGIDLLDQETFQEEFCEIETSEPINDLYISGQFSFVFKGSNNIYYYGDIKLEENFSSSLKIVELKCDSVYFSRNAAIYLKNNRLYLYNKDKGQFEGMYTNYIIAYVVKYLSLFVIIMIIIYMFVSFFEANERYNRYFKAQDNKKTD